VPLCAWGAGGEGGRGSRRSWQPVTGEHACNLYNQTTCNPSPGQDERLVLAPGVYCLILQRKGGACSSLQSDGRAVLRGYEINTPCCDALLRLLRHLLRRHRPPTSRTRASLASTKVGRWRHTRCHPWRTYFSATSVRKSASRLS
jgi:hypothetical protein